MFSLALLTKSKFFIRVALVSFVQHSCRTRIVRVVLALHSSRSYLIRIALMTFVLHSCRTHDIRV